MGRVLLGAIIVVLSALWLLIPGPYVPGPQRPSAPDAQSEKNPLPESKPEPEPQPPRTLQRQDEPVPK